MDEDPFAHAVAPADLYEFVGADAAGFRLADHRLKFGVEEAEGPIDLGSDRGKGEGEKRRKELFEGLVPGAVVADGFGIDARVYADGVVEVTGDCLRGWHALILRRPMATDPIVQVRDLSKIYRQGDIDVTALNRVSVDIQPGEFVALMGPSGSGKSTLLHIVAGIDRPTTGDVLVQGINVGNLTESDLAVWRNQYVGFVFQSFNLIPVLTAAENVELPLLLTGLGRRERQTQVTAALELVGLADRSHHRPDQLSGGQQQRVAIARALVTDPVLIVADEPTGNLDARSATDVLEILRSLSSRAGKTVIMVTHDPKAAGYATRSLHLEKGEIAA